MTNEGSKSRLVTTEGVKNSSIEKTEKNVCTSPLVTNEIFTLQEQQEDGSRQDEGK